MYNLEVNSKVEYITRCFLNHHLPHSIFSGRWSNTSYIVERLEDLQAASPGYYNSFDRFLVDPYIPKTPSIVLDYFQHLKEYRAAGGIISHSCVSNIQIKKYLYIKYYINILSLVDSTTKDLLTNIGFSFMPSLKEQLFSSITDETSLSVLQQLGISPDGSQTDVVTATTSALPSLAEQLQLDTPPQDNDVAEDTNIPQGTVSLFGGQLIVNT